MFAAMAQIQAHQQSCQTNGRTNALDNGHAQLIGEPIGIHMHGALRNAHGQDHIGIMLLNQFARMGHKVCQKLIAITNDIRADESRSSSADNFAGHVIVFDDPPA